MKIMVNDKIYIQKKDLELIFKATNNEEIPNNIIEKYKENIDMKDIGFILFADRKEIDFLNNFWFVVNYSDIIDFDELEIIDYYFKDLQNLRKMRVEHDKNKYLPESKLYDNLLDAYIDQFNYFNYIPSKEEAKNYPFIVLDEIGGVELLEPSFRAALEQILESALSNLEQFHTMGGLVAPGSDAGAWAVPHGCGSEEQLLQDILGENASRIWQKGNEKIKKLF